MRESLVLYCGLCVVTRNDIDQPWSYAITIINGQATCSYHAVYVTEGSFAEALEKLKELEKES